MVIFSREEFIKRIEFLDEYEKWVVDFETLFNCTLDGENYLDWAFTSMLEMLAKGMGEDINAKNGTLVEWFCYDKDFGRDGDHLGGVWFNEKEYAVDNSGDLYDLLVTIDNAGNSSKDTIYERV